MLRKLFGFTYMYAQRISFCYCSCSTSWLFVYYSIVFCYTSMVFYRFCIMRFSSCTTMLYNINININISIYLHYCCYTIRPSYYSIVLILRYYYYIVLLRSTNAYYTSILFCCECCHTLALLIRLYPLEYCFRQLVSTLACLSDLVDIPQYCLQEGVFRKFFVEV